MTDPLRSLARAKRNMKVMTILGTRPEIIRLSRVMARLDAAEGIDHVLVHTGQNYDYELSEVFFTDLGVREPDHYLDVSRDSLGQAYGDILTGTERVLTEEDPDAVLILGDTNSAISAIMAKRMHVPIFHMEAGNRAYDHRVPEEVNRRIVDHTADVNLVYTEHARRNLLREGLHPKNIHLTGSPMREVLNHQRAAIDASTVVADQGLTPGGYVLVSAHREENVDSAGRLGMVVSAIDAVRRHLDMPVLVSVHPRTRKRLEEMMETNAAFDILHYEGITWHAPFGFNDYNRLQLDAACVISDSGTITEEASILGFPAVTIRDSIERPEGLDTGAIVMCGLMADDVVRSVDAVLGAPPSSVPDDYQIEDTSERVLRVLLSRARRSAGHGSTSFEFRL